MLILLCAELLVTRGTRPSPRLIAGCCEKAG